MLPLREMQLRPNIATELTNPGSVQALCQNQWQATPVGFFQQTLNLTKFIIIQLESNGTLEATNPLGMGPVGLRDMFNSGVPQVYCCNINLNHLGLTASCARPRLALRPKALRVLRWRWAQLSTRNC